MVLDMMQQFHLVNTPYIIIMGLEISDKIDLLDLFEILQLWCSTLEIGKKFQFRLIQWIFESQCSSVFVF